MPFSKLRLKQIANEIRKAQKATLKGLRNGEDAASSEILALLKQLSKDLKHQLLDISEEKFQAFHLNRLLLIVDEQIKNFKKRSTDILKGKTKDAVERSKDFWIAQFDALKKVDAFFPAIPPIVSEQTLSVIGNLSTELISGLADDVAKKLKVELQKAVLGSKTPYETARGLDNIIGPRGNVGASAAADRIVRTEVNRAYSMADELMRQTNNDNRPTDAPRLIKIWVTAGDSRVRSAHEEMNLLWVYADDDFRVPIAGKGGDLSGKNEYMSGPHDPKASAGNVVNCRCVIYTAPEYMAAEYGAKEQ